VAKHPSAVKRNRQSEKRKTRNIAVRSRMRRAVKKARDAIEAGAPDKDALVKEALSIVMRTASKRVLKRETASRTMSRLMHAAAAASAPSGAQP
jgi:small subunit ribosomal protein S20